MKASSTNAMNVIIRPLEKVILELTKFLSMEAVRANAMNLTTNYFKERLVVL